MVFQKYNNHKILAKFHSSMLKIIDTTRLMSLSGITARIPMEFVLNIFIKRKTTSKNITVPSQTNITNLYYLEQLVLKFSKEVILEKHSKILLYYNR